MNKGLFYGLLLLLIAGSITACQEYAFDEIETERQGQYYNLSVTCDTCVVNIHNVNGLTSYDMTQTVIGHADIQYPVCDSTFATINQWVANTATYELTYQPSNTYCIGGTRGANIYLEYY